MRSCKNSAFATRKLATARSSECPERLQSGPRRVTLWQTNGSHHHGCGQLKDAQFKAKADATNKAEAQAKAKAKAQATHKAITATRAETVTGAKANAKTIITIIV